MPVVVSHLLNFAVSCSFPLVFYPYPCFPFSSQSLLFSHLVASQNLWGGTVKRGLATPLWRSCQTPFEWTALRLQQCDVHKVLEGGQRRMPHCSTTFPTNGGIRCDCASGPSTRNHKLGSMWLWTRWAFLSSKMNSWSRNCWSCSFCQRRGASRSPYMAFLTCQTVLGFTMFILTKMGGGVTNTASSFVDVCIEECADDVHARPGSWSQRMAGST